MTSPTLGRTEQNSIRNIDDINSNFRGLQLINFSGQIINNVRLPFGKDIAIPHSLKLIPKYRILLKQRGEGIILDSDTPWTTTTVYLKAVSISGKTEGYCDITFILIRS